MMIRKLTVLLMAALFSVSVAGLSFAASHEKKPATTPAAKPGDTPAADPSAAGEMSKKKKPAQKKPDALKAQKAECLKNATTDQAKAECEKKFAEKAKKKATKKKMGEVPGPVEK